MSMYKNNKFSQRINTSSKDVVDMIKKLNDYVTEKKSQKITKSETEYQYSVQDSVNGTMN